jgi:hypothetical protein
MSYQILCWLTAVTSLALFGSAVVIIKLIVDFQTLLDSSNDLLEMWTVERCRSERLMERLQEQIKLRNRGPYR